MITRRKAALALGALATATTTATAAAGNRSVAITIDDLPRGGDMARGQPGAFPALLDLTRRLTGHFRRGRIPFTGFVNSGNWPELAPEQLDRLLRIWLEAGAELGNHTHTHPDFNTVELEAYLDNVKACDVALRRVVKQPRFFRHPFLHAGPTEAKRRGLENYLAASGYRIAPVTFDNSDYMFAALYTGAGTAEQRQRVRDAYLPYMEAVIAFFEERSREVFGREFPQVLLIHSNRLNADAMPELLAMLRRRGYGLVPLETALADPVYASEDGYSGPGGFSWIHRWSRTRGIPNRGEPGEPAFILELFEQLRRSRG